MEFAWNKITIAKVVRNKKINKRRKRFDRSKNKKKDFYAPISWKETNKKVFLLVSPHLSTTPPTFFIPKV